MKKLFVASALLFMGFVASAQPTAPQEKPQPEPKDINKVLEFKNADYDFGKIPFGKAAEYEVTILNVSKDSVVLERVQVGCGCTTPRYDANKKIAPGESIKIGLGFNGATDGAFSKAATIYFSDGMSKQVTFKGETYKTPDTAAPANSGVQKMKTGSK